jgi:hypothetical protein
MGGAGTARRVAARGTLGRSLGPGYGLRGRPIEVTGGNSWQKHHLSSKLNNLS